MYHKNSMATASLVLGILAMLSGSFLFAAVPLGALAVLCAVLSRTDRKMPGKSIAGILAGVIAAISSCVITVQSFHYIMNNAQLRTYCSQIFGTLLEEYGLPPEYNFFDDGSSVSPAPFHSDEPGHSSDDYFDSLYDDYFRYFYGADPYHGETPAPQPQNPSGHVSGGEFI